MEISNSVDATAAALVAYSYKTLLVTMLHLALELSLRPFLLLLLLLLLVVGLFGLTASSIVAEVEVRQR